MRESIHKQGQILEIIHNPHLDYDERIARIREIVGTESKGRRIVQIAATSAAYGDGVYAICDDGSTWGLSVAERNKQWFRLPDIPQDEPAEPDPIAEIEAMGGQLHVDSIAGLLTWHSDGAREIVGRTATLGGIRAAAARLLARVRGASDAS